MIRNLIPIALLIAAIGCSGSSTKPALPPVDQIISISASIQQPDPAFDEFEIPKQDWERVLETMRDATKDDAPAKWEVAGNMQIDDGKDSTVDIWIYYTSEINAFSVETSEERTYYRTTKANATLNAVRESYLNNSKHAEY